LDGTLQGPDAMFGLIEQYLSQLGIDEATKLERRAFPVSPPTSCSRADQQSGRRPRRNA
jgi:hypothetical protein